MCPFTGGTGVGPKKFASSGGLWPNSSEPWNHQKAHARAHNPAGPPSRERKEPRGDAAAATVCGPRSLASGLAAGGDEERGSVSSTDRLFS